MEKGLMGFKELTDVILSSPHEQTINGIKVPAGEPIAIFQRVQTGSLMELKDRYAASGGYNNGTLLTWESTQKVDFSFTQGVLSKMHIALTSNSQIKSNNKVAVPMIELLETNESLQVELKHAPGSHTVYVYLYETNERITDFTIEGNILTLELNKPFTAIQVIYNFDYINESSTILVGDRMLNGFLELSGKTRLKDDETGKVVTGIIKIPKLQLVSDLSIRLGVEGSPTTGDFKITGIPVGPKKNERVLDFTILSDDVDSDI